MIVLDSSFLIAFHNARDVHHDRAVAVMDRFLEGEWGQGLLLEYVLLEVTTVLALRRSLDVAVSVGDTLLRARELEFAPCSEIFLDAFSTFRNQSDGDLSFVDAAIVTAAALREISHVASFDESFRGLNGITLVP